MRVGSLANQAMSTKQTQLAADCGRTPAVLLASLRWVGIQKLLQMPLSFPECGNNRWGNSPELRGTSTSRSCAASDFAPWAGVDAGRRTGVLPHLLSARGKSK
jgi:hypothetical protein